MVIPTSGWLAKLIVYKYWLMFPLALVEGPILMVACGFLLRLGLLSFWPSFLVLILGDFAADLGWYAVGFFGARKFIQRWGRFFDLTEDKIAKIEKIFKRRQNRILFLSKITMGFGFALVTLVTAGLIRVPFKHYAWFNFLGGFIWTAFLMALGYWFGNLYSAIDKSFRLAFVGFLIVLILAALWGFSRFARKRVTREADSE